MLKNRGSERNELAPASAPEAVLTQAWSAYGYPPPAIFLYIYIYRYELGQGLTQV